MAERTDIYASVTDRVVKQLEEERIVPWRKPWRSHGVPYNILTGRQYHGINLLLLTLDNYGDPRWGTFKAMREAAAKQAVRDGREIEVEKTKTKRGFEKTNYYEIVDGQRVWFGGGVRAKEKGTHIVLVKRVPKTRKNEGGEDEDGSYTLMTSYVVFNAEQADGIAPFVEEPREFTPIESAQRIVDAYVGHPGPAVLYGKAQALYNLRTDMLEMPNPEDFFEDEPFYGTVFHELVHSTGHESRLKRIEPALFGSDPYSKEELVAEIGASFLCGLAGLSIAGDEQSAAYIDHWLGVLRGSRTLIVKAAAAAQRATDLIMDTVPEAERAEVEEVQAA